MSVADLNVVVLAVTGLLIVPSRARRQVERRLQAVHRAGRLTRWLAAEDPGVPQPGDSPPPDTGRWWHRGLQRLRAAVSRRSR